MSSLVVSVAKEPDESVSLSYPDELNEGDEELDVGDDLIVKVNIDQEYQTHPQFSSASSAFSEEAIALLHEQMEVSKDYDSRYNTSALFLRGVEKLSDSDVLQYFKDFDPITVTRKGDNTCVVEFPNSRLTTEALLTLSKPLKRVSRELTNYSQFDEEETVAKEPDDNNFTSPLAKDGKKGLTDVDMEVNSKTPEPHADSAEFREVDVSRFKVPDGHWRVGEQHLPKADLLLMQFARVATVEEEVDNRRPNRKRKIVGNTITIAGDLRDRLTSKRPQKGLDDSWESVEDGDEEEVDNGHDDRDRHAYVDVEETSSEELEKILSRDKLRPTMKMRADEEEEAQRKKREETARRPGEMSRKAFDLRDRIKSHQRH